MLHGRIYLLVIFLLLLSFDLNPALPVAGDWRVRGTDLLQVRKLCWNCDEHQMSRIFGLAQEILTEEKSSAGNEGEFQPMTIKGFPVSACREVSVLETVLGMRSKLPVNKASRNISVGSRLQHPWAWSRRASHLRSSASCLASSFPYGVWLYISHQEIYWKGLLRSGNKKVYN